MKQIIIIGGGFAGLRLLYRLSRSLKGKAAITLIDRSEFSIEKPSLPEVAFAGKEVSKVRIPISGAVRRRGGKFLRDAVKEINPEENELTTESEKSSSTTFWLWQLVRLRTMTPSQASGILVSLYATI